MPPADSLTVDFLVSGIARGCPGLFQDCSLIHELINKPRLLARELLCSSHNNMVASRSVRFL